jgi:hypothetical protein
MASTNLKPSRPETDAETHRRLTRDADAADAQNPSAAQRRRQRTLKALADVNAGRLITDEAMQSWANSLGTSHDLPVPESGRCEISEPPRHDPTLFASTSSWPQ